MTDPPVANPSVVTSECERTKALDGVGGDSTLRKVMESSVRPTSLKPFPGAVDLPSIESDAAFSARMLVIIPNGTPRKIVGQISHQVESASHRSTADVIMVCGSG